MLKKTLSIFTAVLLLAGLLVPVMACATETMYVYTENGKGLNIRYAPSTDSETLTSAAFGSKITVKNHLGNGWTAIYWGGDDVFYVQTRFLVYEKPTKKPTPKKTESSSKNNTAVTNSAATVADLNKIFKTFKAVDDSYAITVRPSRPSGWVNVRFAPSKQAELVTTKRDGDQMYVIGELQDWYQVQDPVTGSVGYINVSFVVK